MQSDGSDGSPLRPLHDTPLLMQHEVRHASANQAVDLCADLCANSAKRAESEQNQENIPVLVTPITATLRRPRTY